MTAQSRPKSRRRPADPAAAAGKTGIARAFLHPVAAHVGRVQARYRQGNHPRRDHHGGAPRPDRLVRRARPAKSGRRHADGARHPLSHLLDDKADRLHRHHDAARRGPSPVDRPRRQIHSGILQPEGRRRDTTASSIWCRWRGRSPFRTCCGTPLESPTNTPAMARCIRCISSRRCEAARSAMPNTLHWSRVCRWCASRAPNGITAVPPTSSAASSKSFPAKRLARS